MNANDSKYSNSATLLPLLRTLLKWRKTFVVYLLVAILLSVVVSLLLTNYYRAQAVITPAAEEQSLLTIEGSLFGTEDAVDRTLIMAQSNKMAERVINKFNLAQRYDIDDTTPKGRYQVLDRFFSLYEVKKNELNGIELSLEDTDPEMAATLMRGVLEEIQRLYKEATATPLKRIINNFEQAISNKELRLQEAADTLRNLRQRYDIYNVRQQGQLYSSLILSTETMLSEQRARLKSFKAINLRDSVRVIEARVQGLAEKLKSITRSDSTGKSRLDRFNEGREAVTYFEELSTSLQEDLGLIRARYEEYRAMLDNTQSAIIVLEPVEVPKIKSYPIRWLIVAGTTVVAFVLGILGIFAIEQWKELGRAFKTEEQNTTA